MRHIEPVKFLVWILSFACFVARAAPPTEPLAFDALAKELTPKSGEMNALFTFSLTNVSSGEVVINNVRTSCGCTVAKVPSKPWLLTPGTNGSFEPSNSSAPMSGAVPSPA